MRLTLVADCSCKKQHVVYNYNDTYHKCYECKEDLDWYDPYEELDEFEQRQRESDKKHFRREK